MSTYIDCNGEVQNLDDFHYHELIDRLHCLGNIWETMIENHPACKSVLEGKSEEVQSLIPECYQIAGRVAFNKDKS